MLDVPFTAQHAQQIVEHHYTDVAKGTVHHFEEVEDQEAYCYTPRIKTFTFVIRAGDNSDTGSSSGSSKIHPFHISLAVLPRSNGPTTVYQRHGNDLDAIDDIIKRVHASSDVPLPSTILDTTLALIPYPYLIYPLPSHTLQPLSTVRKTGLLDAQNLARIELRLGTYLARLHALQNDWFGAPVRAVPSDASYRWQESFTTLLEGAMEDLEMRMGASSLPFWQIRKHLSRAIGFFLFDDVEVPSLVGFALSEDDVLVSVSDGEEAHIGTILPRSFNWAVWGDPLLETLFMPPGPEDAVLEGYRAAGGAELIVFLRQKTKRLWYTLFLALIVLERLGDEDTQVALATRDWALNTVHVCVKELEEAPCY